MTVVYGFCFGVELTMNNIIVTYLFDQFGLSLTIAGVLGSLFGLMNLFARSIGGLGSDLAGKYFGMRGRLWALWLIQTAEGIFCIFMGLAKNSLGATIALMVIFSLLVQSSEGASYGVVPFVSKRALGVVSGFVGAGGNAGSVITQTLFFGDIGGYETYEGLIYMGIMVICCTLLVLPIYFPMWGGMFCPPRDGVVEEDYYLNEFSQEEREAGLADAAIKFAQESRSQRGQVYEKRMEKSQNDIKLPGQPAAVAENKA
jgi:MFS transporter, NNP family, nitrate/nitrite transporter